MGKKIDFICKNCGYKVFASSYGGGFDYESSSYSCFVCKNVTEITEWADGEDEAPRTYYEIKCAKCGNADPKTLHKWQHDGLEIENNDKPCPVCKTKLSQDPSSFRIMLSD